MKMKINLATWKNRPRSRHERKYGKCMMMPM